jgi:hypothetical protein
MTAPLLRDTKRRRLERAGYVHLSGWVPAAYAAKVTQQVGMHAEDVARVLAEPAKPRGRPRKGS